MGQNTFNFHRWKLVTMEIKDMTGSPIDKLDGCHPGCEVYSDRRRGARISERGSTRGVWEKLLRKILKK